jgi:hypothetical protein
LYYKFGVAPDPRLNLSKEGIYLIPAMILDTPALCLNEDDFADFAREVHDKNLSDPDLSNDPEIVLLLQMLQREPIFKKCQATSRTSETLITGGITNNLHLPPPSKSIRRNRKALSSL